MNHDSGAKEEMFRDKSEIFSRLFVPYEDGYIVYPGKSKGGKFVTAAERDALVKNYQRWWGKRFSLGLGVWAFIAVLLPAIAAAALLNVPDGDFSFVILAAAIVLGYFVIRSFRAPYRLVKDRPDIVPPRTKEENRRVARSYLTWPRLAGQILIVAILLFSLVTNYANAWHWLLWTAGATLFLMLLLYVAIRKYLDMVNT